MSLKYEQILCVVGDSAHWSVEFFVFNERVKSLCKHPHKETWDSYVLGSVLKDDEMTSLCMLVDMVERIAYVINLYHLHVSARSFANLPLCVESCVYFWISSEYEHWECTQDGTHNI